MKFLKRQAGSATPDRMHQKRRLTVLLARRLQGHPRAFLKATTPTVGKPLLGLATILVSRRIQSDFIQMQSVGIRHDDRHR